MRVDRDELKEFNRSVGPAPAPIEPRLSAAQEAALIAKGKDGDPEVAARRARVLTILRRPAAPEGADAELVTLLAAARALPLENRVDRIKARLRLLDIGRAKELPPEVRNVFQRLRLSPGDAAAFAHALLPPEQDLSAFSENFPVGSGGGGGGGG